MNSRQSHETVEKLRFPDNIRTRPGMYTDDIETPNVMLRELVDNCVDIILKNQISLNIKVFTNFDGYHLVMDNGQGLPLYKDKDYDNQPITIDLLSNTHVGTNFKRTTYSIGMNGVGSKLTNALSDRFVVFVNATKQNPEVFTPDMKSAYESGNTVFYIEFRKGILYKTDMLKVADIPEVFNHPDFNTAPSIMGVLNQELFSDFGTVLIFTPDLSIIGKNKVEYHSYPFKLMSGLFRHDSLYKDLNINFSLNGKTTEPYNFGSYYSLDELVGNKFFEFSGDISTHEKFPLKFLGSFGYDKTKMDFESIGSVNLLRTHNGKHITIFQRALGKALHRFNPLVKIPDAKYGLRSFTLSFSVEPFFEGQTKTKLGQFLDKGYNENRTIDALADILYEEVLCEDMEYFKGLCNKIIEYKKTLDRLSKKDFVLSHIEYADDPTASLGLGARVYDCKSNNVEERELYLTEGKSAGTSIVRSRTKETQRWCAVLPMRGVPLNAATSNINKIVQNDVFRTMIKVLGTGLDPFIKMDLKRYGKIVIAADADPAGKFIQSLLLGFIGMYLRPWIDEGRVYLVVPPLYRQGKKYLYNDKELDYKKPFTRFKGLGEMSPNDVKDTLIENRILVKITSEDIDEALKLIINASNERKTLSKELGILTDAESFQASVDESEADILGNFESISNQDDEDDASEEGSDDFNSQLVEDKA